MAFNDTVDQFVEDVGITHQIVHGSSTQTVTTEGGPVKTLAKMIKDGDDAAEAAEVEREERYNVFQADILELRGQAQQYAQTAAAQSSLATTSAQAAGSWQQHDLSGVDAVPLYRSPNLVVQSLIYDLSKDSDGGSWRERCDGLSWQNDDLNGTWIPSDAHTFNGVFNELQARCYKATTGAELITNSNDRDFSSDTGFWTKNTGWTITGGKAVHTGAADYLQKTGLLTANKVYRVEVEIAITGSANSNFAQIYDGTNTYVTLQTNGKHVVYLPMTAGGLGFAIRGTGDVTVDNISLKEVTGVTTLSGDYYQLTTDGKFYRLWKNRYAYWNDFTQTPWSKTQVTVVSKPDSIGDKIVETATSGSHNVSQGKAVIGLPCTMTIRAKAGERSWIALHLGGFNAYVNLSTGTLGTVAGGVTASVTASGVAGYYDCTLTATPINTNSFVYLATGDGANSYVGDGTSGVYIARAQLEISSTFTTWETKSGVEAEQSETFRGNTAKFPRLAAIVAEATRVSIFAIDQPGRPMWAARPALSSGTPAITGIAAREGCIAVVGNAALTAFQLWDFAGDRIRYKGASNTSMTFYGVLKQTHVPQSITTDGGGGLVSSSINGVAMCTIPDAPVDPSTGLQIPTIAIATNSGVNVIQNDGTVRASSSALVYTQVEISKDVLWANRGTNSSSSMYALRPNTVGAAFALSQLNENSFPDFIYLSSNRAAKLQIVGRSTVARASAISGSSVGYLELLRSNEGAIGQSMTARIGGQFTSGWMVGDIRRAVLTGTTAGSVTDVSLVTNGTFDTDLTGWTNNGGTQTWTAGKLRRDGTGTGGGSYQEVATTIGQAYTLNATFSTVSGAGSPTITAYVGGGFVTTLATGTPGTPLTFVATSTSTRIYLFTSSTLVGDFDDVVLVTMVADRSYKAKHLSAVGTVNRAAVSTGAQLIGYSGFSTTSYLREAYSADLDFGTTGFSAMGWFKIPSNLPAVGSALDQTYSTKFVATGPELLTNGTFNSGSTGWTVSGADATHIATFNGSTLRYQSDTSSPTLSVFQTVLTTGKMYVVTTVCSAYTSGSVKLDVTGGPMVIASGVGTTRLVFQAGGTSLSILRTSSNVDLTLDSISVQEVLPVFVMDRSAASGAYWRMGYDAAGKVVAEVYDGTTTRTVTSPSSYAGLNFCLGEMDLQTSGSLLLRMNGRQVAATHGNPLLTLNNASALFTIGNNFAAQSPALSDVALVRVSATVPTEDQSLFVYEQEKRLFRDNAQIALSDGLSLTDASFSEDRGILSVLNTGFESSFSGLVRTRSIAVSVGNDLKITRAAGNLIVARSTLIVGADISTPSQNLREELLRRGEARASATYRAPEMFEWVGGFTANTHNVTTPTALLSASPSSSSWVGSVMPIGSTVLGVQITGTGIPASTSITQTSGTTVYIDKPATAVGTGVSVAFQDFMLPLGFEPRWVYVSGILMQEGATKDYTVLFDGFRYRVRFAVSPGATARVQIQTRRFEQ